jgi:quinoprotein glucose dehydrogenase
MRNHDSESTAGALAARPSRREVLIAGTALVTVPLVQAQTASAGGQTPSSPAGRTVGWASYGGDKASTKYSALALIDRGNFSRLKVVWTWPSVEADVVRANPGSRTWAWESTPLMVDGVVYVSTSLSQVAALDAATGKTKWVYDPETWKNGTPSNNGFVHRGVAFWADGNDRRIVFGTGDGYLICLDAETGRPLSTFGQHGRIDLTQGLGRDVNRRHYGVSSPPIICRDVIVMGSKVHDVPVAAAMPPGDVRGFDVRTGRQLWQFKAVPGQGEFGNETWDNDSWKTTGGTNVWTLVSADDDLGYVYLPVSTPSNDFYGGQRGGDGLYGESLVCLDARTGTRIWHFQLVHHGLWDYDPPAAPNLIDIRVNGTLVKAVAQVSKQGFVYVFDRVNGRPIWPIEERPVPQSTVPGEKSSRTQPFPTKPSPFDRQGVTEDDVVDFTPELRKEALSVLAKYHYGPLYTPPSLEKPTIQMPGYAGGASWSGAACDPDTGIMYVTSITNPLVVTLAHRPEQSPAPYTGAPGPMETLQGVPLWKPPYGRITTIDLNTGEHGWMVPMGSLDHPRFNALGLGPLGRPTRGHTLLTKTLVIVGQEGTTQRAEGGAAAAPNFTIQDPTLRAYDKATGRVVGEVGVARPPTAPPTAAPMTYMLNGQQYIVVATGGSNLPAELVALKLI